MLYFGCSFRDDGRSGGKELELLFLKSMVLRSCFNSFIVSIEWKEEFGR